MDAQTLSLAMGGSALALSLYNCATAMPRGVYAKGGSPFCASSALLDCCPAAWLLQCCCSVSSALPLPAAPRPRGPTPSFPTRSPEP